jgi:hypothetical protein
MPSLPHPESACQVISAPTAGRRTKSDIFPFRHPGESRGPAWIPAFAGMTRLSRGKFPPRGSQLTSLIAGESGRDDFAVALAPTAQRQIVGTRAHRFEGLAAGGSFYCPGGFLGIAALCSPKLWEPARLETLTRTVGSALMTSCWRRAALCRATLTTHSEGSESQVSDLPMLLPGGPLFARGA